MRAVVQDGYGSADLLEVREIDIPTVADDEVLVRVRAASVHPDVWHVVSGRPYVLRLMGSGLRSPKNRVPGTDVAGHVESVGGKVARFRPGMRSSVRPSAAISGTTVARMPISWPFRKTRWR